MDFLTKKFSTKEELVDFVREYCYSYGYLTVIRSSSNKRGEIFIICNCSGEEKKSKDKTGAEGDGNNTNLFADQQQQEGIADGRKAKRQKLTKCPFRVNGRRITEEGEGSESYWQITIFNNSHNHLPVVDFTQSTSINVVGNNNNRNGLGMGPQVTGYNTDLDMYDASLGQAASGSNIGNNNATTGTGGGGSGGENVVLHSNLFTSQIVKAVNRKLSSLTPQKQTVFLNKFNKLLYEDMPDLPDTNLQPVIIQNQDQSSSSQLVLQPPNITLPSNNNSSYPDSNNFLGAGGSNSQHHHNPTGLHPLDDFSNMQHQGQPRERSNSEQYNFQHQLSLPTHHHHHQQYPVNDSQLEFETHNQTASQAPKSRLCKKCGQMGHNSRTCTIHLNTSLLQ
jgi:hypothetical protein